MQVGRRRATTPALLVVEDDELVRHSFVSVLEEHARVEVAATLDEAERAIAGARWAGIVLDVQLPDGSGLALLESLRARHIATPGLVVAGGFGSSVAERCHALDAECVFKPDVHDDLLHFAARAVMRFDATEARTTTTIDTLRQSLGLTARETDFLERLARGERRDGLATSAGVTLNTAKTMVRRVLQKFDERTVEAVARAVFEEMLRDDGAERGRPPPGGHGR